MRLTHLHIHNFRNIGEISLTPDPAVNLVTGHNAAGKTSLLEAIYYLSHLRSFRTQQVTDLIRTDNRYLQISARVQGRQQEDMPIGIRRSREKTEIRVNRQPIKKVSDIAAVFPVLAIHPDSYKLITGSPSQRRQYMDWGVFHVERGFFNAWQRFRKAIAQRNAALKSRQDKNYCQLWDAEIVRCAEEINQLRQQYIDQLQGYFRVLASEFFAGDEVRVEYRRGWPTKESLADLYAQSIDKDRLKGFTYYGPHRAEIIIRVNGQSAQTGISRGQQKTLVALLRLAQAQQFTQSNQQPCVLLYDDLAAELDARHREMILSVLSTMQIQLFLTAIEAEQIDLSAWSSKKMFHVEHGCLKDLI